MNGMKWMALLAFGGLVYLWLSGLAKKRGWFSKKESGKRVAAPVVAKGKAAGVVKNAEKVKPTAPASVQPAPPSPEVMPKSAPAVEVVPLVQPVEAEDAGRPRIDRRMQRFESWEFLPGDDLIWLSEKADRVRWPLDVSRQIWLDHLRPLLPLMRREDVSEIIVNDDMTVVAATSYGGIIPTKLHFNHKAFGAIPGWPEDCPPPTPESLIAGLRTLHAQSFGLSQTLVYVRLEDGSQFRGILPPSPNSVQASLSIRKMPKEQRDKARQSAAMPSARDVETAVISREALAAIQSSGAPVSPEFVAEAIALPSSLDGGSGMPTAEGEAAPSFRSAREAIQSIVGGVNALPLLGDGGDKIEGVMAEAFIPPASQQDPELPVERQSKPGVVKINKGVESSEPGYDLFGDFVDAPAVSKRVAVTPSDDLSDGLVDSAPAPVDTTGEVQTPSFAHASTTIAGIPERCPVCGACPIPCTMDEVEDGTLVVCDECFNIVHIVPKGRVVVHEGRTYHVPEGEEFEVPKPKNESSCKPKVGLDALKALKPGVHVVKPKDDSKVLDIFGDMTDKD